MIGATCSTCAFFSPPPYELHERNPKGQCRRHAPRIDRDEARGIRTVWPLVGDQQWCGEHSTIEGAE